MLPLFGTEDGTAGESGRGGGQRVVKSVYPRLSPSVGAAARISHARPILISPDSTSADTESSYAIGIEDHAQRRCRGGSICGPDITEAFVAAFREEAKVPGIPKLGLGGRFDFKFGKIKIPGKCPKECNHTVMLCEICVTDDVPGNIALGYYGGAAGYQLALRAILAASDFFEHADAEAQKKGPDPGFFEGVGQAASSFFGAIGAAVGLREPKDPRHDRAAITIGHAFSHGLRTAKAFCDLVNKHKKDIVSQKRRKELAACERCPIKWKGKLPKPAGK